MPAQKRMQSFFVEKCFQKVYNTSVYTACCGGKRAARLRRAFYLYCYNGGKFYGSLEKSAAAGAGSGTGAERRRLRQHGLIGCPCCRQRRGRQPYGKTNRGCPAAGHDEPRGGLFGCERLQGHRAGRNRRCRRKLHRRNIVCRRLKHRALLSVRRCAAEQRYRLLGHGYWLDHQLSVRAVLRLQ